MSKKHDQKFYLRKCRDCLEEIKITPADNGARFLLLKKKAKKYLELAKSFEKPVPPTG